MKRRGFLQGILAALLPVPAIANRYSINQEWRPATQFSGFKYTITDTPSSGIYLFLVVKGARHVLGVKYQGELCLPDEDGSLSPLSNSAIDAAIGGEKG